MKTLTINGMHCDACKTLITMELDEGDLSSLISEIKQDGENTGTIRLKADTTDDEMKKIAEIINQMDNYSVS